MTYLQAGVPYSRHAARRKSQTCWRPASTLVVTYNAQTHTVSALCEANGAETVEMFTPPGVVINPINAWRQDVGQIFADFGVVYRGNSGRVSADALALTTLRRTRLE
ncbi:MAG: hypothetical protein BMS9Abin10_0486 [Gammaproteobacteria bacterium]|nr:MAG: hypothetical protein BMS9Abin10_0486 [Gammaproteobacteria bacterium]